MRRLSDRARLEGMIALRKALEGVRRSGQVATARNTPDDVARSELRDRRVGDASWSRRSGMTARDITLAPEPSGYDIRLDDTADDAPRVQDAELAKALNRISDSIERIGAQLDSYHLERAEHLDAIEFLLREMVISSVPPTASRSSIFGGVVESPRDRDEIAIVPDGFPIERDTPVEVRSRFHDRWISGFSIAEAVDTPGRCRYRLTRLSDGIPLPILFEACDVRAASSTPDRNGATAARAPLNESRIRS
jgi:hypothetical protein